MCVHSSTGCGHAHAYNLYMTTQASSDSHCHPVSYCWENSRTAKGCTSPHTAMLTATASLDLDRGSFSIYQEQRSSNNASDIEVPHYRADTSSYHLLHVYMNLLRVHMSSYFIPCQYTGVALQPPKIHASKGSGHEPLTVCGH